jgi:hypothetical protein
VIERLEPDPDILAVHLCFSRPSCQALCRASTTLFSFIRTRMAGTSPATTLATLTR